MTGISTHILDIARGIPVADVTVILIHEDADRGKEEVDRKKTNANGRIDDFRKLDRESGNFRLVFEIRDYYSAIRQASFFSSISVEFRITGDAHYHIPLLLTPYGYSTYRGS